MLRDERKGKEKRRECVRNGKEMRKGMERSREERTESRECDEETDEMRGGGIGLNKKNERRKGRNNRK